MRVVRFRGKRIDNGEWVYGFYVEGVSNGSNRMLQHGILERGYYPIEVDQKTVGQYTGLKDKNGVEIYECDILYHHIQGKRKVYYPFNERVASYGLENLENGMRSTLQDSHAIYEVIGNTHDNPEPLEVK